MLSNNHKAPNIINSTLAVMIFSAFLVVTVMHQRCTAQPERSLNVISICQWIKTGKYCQHDFLAFDMYSNFTAFAIFIFPPILIEPLTLSNIYYNKTVFSSFLFLRGPPLTHL